MFSSLEIFLVAYFCWSRWLFAATKIHLNLRARAIFARLLHFLTKKISAGFGIYEFSLTFAAEFKKQLGYGVMVTLQILVLSFLVRIQVAQQKKRVTQHESKWLASFLYLCRPVAECAAGEG
jgi:hypothetical protein